MTGKLIDILPDMGTPKEAANPRNKAPTLCAQSPDN